MENIYVWSFDEVLCDWILNNTGYYKGTTYEYNYYRVIVDGTKQYYFSMEDYLSHRINNLPHTKKLRIWSKNDYNKWENNYTDLNVGTGDEFGLYTYNTGKNKQYYYSYLDMLEHQYKNETFYKI